MFLEIRIKPNDKLQSNSQNMLVASHGETVLIISFNSSIIVTAMVLTGCT